MRSRTGRNVALIVALWAVLFAPGALGEHADTSRIPDASQMAAAVVAPTFSIDILLAARPCDGAVDDLGDACDGVGSLALALASALLVAGLAVPITPDRAGSWVAGWQRTLAPRGPPSS